MTHEAQIVVESYDSYDLPKTSLMYEERDVSAKTMH